MSNQIEASVRRALREGRPDEARRLLREVVTEARGAGDLLRRAGRYEEARSCYHEALGLYRSTPGIHPGELANAVRPMALLLEAVGDIAAARHQWLEARQLYERAEVPPGVQECAEALARLAAE